jgi:hypothetical protein
MPQLTERDAEKLTPGQATALVRVIDLQARWDGLLADKQQNTGVADLHARQKANDAYRVALRDYGAMYHTAAVPEPTHALPDRLGVWCRVLRVVFGKAEGDSPVGVLGKVYRLADRIAARTGTEPVGRGPAEDLPAAVRELDAVIAWCEALVPPTPLRKLEKDEAA